MKKKKRELKVGDIWAVPPLEKTLDVRKIFSMRPISIQYVDFDGYYKRVREVDFHSWITRKKAEKIGRYDFKTEKAVSVKGGKG